MSLFYSKMANVATKLLTRFNQGSISYIEHGLESGPDWSPSFAPETVHKLKATASGVSEQYRDNTIVSTDLEVTAAVFGVEPTVRGLIRIDGKDLQIIRVIPLPSAGTVCAWKMLVRA